VAWYYEKVGESGQGLDDVSQKLYLVDANDGGDSSLGAGSVDWTILATIDLSAAPSGWHILSISIDAAGNGTALFDQQAFNFTTAAGLAGEFYVDYRENAQLGSATVPEAILRPATFAQVPEPSTLALGIIGAALTCFVRRRR
jgi:hypothetical protein